MNVDEAKAQLIADRLAARWPNIDLGMAQMFDEEYASNGNDADAAFATASAYHATIGPELLKRGSAQ